MKVLHIANHFWPSTGGVEKFILDLCRESKKLGIETEVLCLNSPHHSKEILPPTDEIDGIKITRIPYLNLKYYKPALLPIEKLKSADILHVHGVGALLDFCVLTRPLHSRPIVVSTHGGIFHTTEAGFLKQAYFLGLQKLMLKGAAIVVACSKNDEELFRKVTKTLTRIDNGVETGRFDACTGPKKPNSFLFVGRISRNKRIEQVLKTLSVLKKKGIVIEFRIVGEDWEGLREKLAKKAGELGIGSETVFLGKRSDTEVLAEYCSAGFFVSASQYEGFGISAIEGMAAGCVPLLNRIEAFSNFVSTGKNGFLVDFPDPEKAARQIGQAMKQDLSLIRQAAKKTAEEYSWKTKVSAWKALYEKIAKETRQKGAWRAP